MNDIDRFNRLSKWGNMGLGDYITMAILGQAGIMTGVGKQYFANDDTSRGSDRYDGSFGRPFLTIKKAVDMSVVGRGDVIFLQSGCGTNYTDYDIDLTAMTVLTIIGLNDPSGSAVLIKPTIDPATAIFKLGANSKRIQLINLGLSGAGDGGNDVIMINSTGADNISVIGCTASNGTFINTTNAASSSSWKISKNRLLNTVNGIKGYLGLAEIDHNIIRKTVTTELTVGISLLDNGDTADSDGALIHHNTILGGIEGTTPLANGILVAAACYGVGIWENRVSGCTDNISYAANTVGTHAMFNMTDDGRNGGGNWADAQTYLLT